MARYIVQRFLQCAALMFLVSLLAFLAVHVIGNPIDVLMSPNFTQTEYDLAMQALGLDRPLPVQYLMFMKNLLKGDLGTSFVFGTSALRVIVSRVPATLELAFSAMLLAILIGLPLGVLAGLRPGSATGRVIMAGSILGFSVPTFWQGIMLIMVFSVMLGWLPAVGRGRTVELLGVPVSLVTLDGLRHLVLPAFNLALFKMSLIVRTASASTREVALQDYVKFAMAKGLGRCRVIAVHILRNTLIPVVTVIGLELGGLIAYAVVTETIFAWPGMGKLIIDSIHLLDRPVIVAYLIFTVLVFIVINFLVDVLYAVLDPRIRLHEEAS